MDARSFLSAVIPWDSGYATVHWKGPRTGFLGRSYRTVDELLAQVARLKEIEGTEIWFCLSRQKLNSGKRLRANAIGLNSVFADADVDPDNPRKYPTLEKAVAAIFYFCQLLELPRPSYMVHSGGGVHAYWVSIKTLTVEEWQPYADAIKAAARNVGLKIDFGVTGDAARVLRVPDTFNWKTGEPRPVRLLTTCSTGRTHDFAVIFAGLLKLAPVQAKPNGKLGTVASAFAHLPLASNLGKGVESHPPIPLEPVIAGCPWMREAWETGGKEFDEPQWNLTTLIATWMEDGNELAHKLGNQHPDYDFHKTEAKWDRKIRERGNKNIGWPLCRTVQNSGSRHCAGCPRLVLDQSPLHLGLAASHAPQDEEVEELGGKPSGEFELPKGFCFNAENKICAIVPGKPTKNGGVTPTRLLELMSNTIKNPSLQNQQGTFGLGFTASTDKGGEHDVFIPSTHLGDAKLRTHLGAAFVLCHHGKEVGTFMDKLVITWMQKLANEQKALRDAGTLGWRFEEGKRIGFVYGGTLWGIDGTSTPVTNTTDDEFRRWYVPVGAKEPWFAAAKLLIDRKRPELDVLIAIAFASPLLSFAGTIYGIILSTWGDPGTAKSTAQQIAAAVWGHPKQTRESLNSTAKSVQSRLGRTKNLPAYWDDIQDERHQENLFQTMFVTSQGSEGGRLNPDASYKERKDWQTLMVACSNASFIEFLVKKQKSTTAGMRRVFEFQFNKRPDEPGMIDFQDASRAFALLEHNYGMVGMEYAKLLATDYERIDKLLYGVTQEFKAAVKGTSDEDFWWNLCGVLITGAMLANELGTGLDVPKMAGFLARAYLSNRRIRNDEGTEGGSWTNTEQHLAAFLNHHMGLGHVIYTDVTFVHKNRKIVIIRHPEKGKPVYVHVVRDERRVIISKRRLREWLQEREVQTKQVLDGLVRYLKAKELKLTLAGGTGLGLTQEVCLDIPVPPGKHLLEELLTVVGQPGR